MKLYLNGKEHLDSSVNECHLTVLSLLVEQPEIKDWQVIGNEMYLTIEQVYVEG
jgi:hypothetical protein